MSSIKSRVRNFLVERPGHEVTGDYVAKILKIDVKTARETLGRLYRDEGVTGLNNSGIVRVDRGVYMYRERSGGDNVVQMKDEFYDDGSNGNNGDDFTENGTNDTIDAGDSLIVITTLNQARLLLQDRNGELYVARVVEI